MPLEAAVGSAGEGGPRGRSHVRAMIQSLVAGMDKRAIARITVGEGRGTGFLVSRDGLVLTALHVVADLDGSRRNQRLKRLPEPIVLRFGDPNDGNTWGAERVSIVPELYSLESDWAVLQCCDPIPDDVVPFSLAALDDVYDLLQWKTFGFPDAAAHVGGDFCGKITSWERRARLHSGAAAGVRMKGISGAPCVVAGDTVALIDSALLDNDGRCQGGALLAMQTRAIVEAAGGRLPFSQRVAVPFEREVRNRLPRDDAGALRAAARELGTSVQPEPDDIARGVILAGIRRAADVLRVLDVRIDARNEIIDMVAAAQLHHEAVDRLADATSALRPGVVRASAEETCTWYTQRAHHKLARDVWGDRLLHVDVAGREESAPAGADGDPIAVAADELLRLIRAKAERQWGRGRFRTRALAGDLGAPFCVALHNETRVAVVEALRGRLPNAHLLLVTASELILSEADRERVATIAPHLQDEDGLLLAYDTVRTTTD